MTEDYPFYKYCNEPKDRYKHAKDCGYVDDDDLFLIGDSGGFLLNIIPGARFVDTWRFTEMADYYRKKKTYTELKVDSIPHRMLRKREEHRRANGFVAPCLMMPDGTIKDVRITGAHYNFLNYTRIEQLNRTTIRRGVVYTARKAYDFPKFFDSQFYVFHVMEFAERNGFHLIICKTRRGGFSYMMASDSSNTVNGQSRKVVIHVANDKKYLTQSGGLTDFSVNNLKFYEENTPFIRGVVSSVKSDFRLGYKLVNGIEADNSWHSSLISVSANSNPDCAIGKDAVKVKVEEVSTMNNFEEFLYVTEPAMRTGAYTTGSLQAWGTATSGDMQSFERIFFSPKSFNFMPFENVWDKDSRNEVCGFFKPYCWGLEGEINGSSGVDSNGNSNILIGLEISIREREIKRENVTAYSDYVNYVGQYANSPSESFSNVSENLFSSEELTEWEEKLKYDSDLRFYSDGQMVKDGTGTVKFVSNTQLAKQGKKVYDYIVGVPRKTNEDPHGCVRIWFFPESVKEDLGEGNYKTFIPKGLYSITYDPVGVDKEKKEITMKHSHNSIKVWMNPHAINGFKQKLVASFYGRPEKLEEADRICFLLAVYYNCVGTTNVEVNRGETVSNFRKWNGLKYLSSEPLFVWDSTIKTKYSTSYGYNISNSAQKLDGLRLLKEFLYTVIGTDMHGNPVRNFHNIYDYQSILELKKWNSSGNFDRVSEMILRGIEWKSMNLLAEDELRGRNKLKNEEKDKDNVMMRDWF